MIRAKELIIEGKRAPVENRIKHKTYAPRAEEKHPKYLAQKAIDDAVREKLNCKASEVRILTQEEIQAISGQITPIERVKSTTKHTILFAEVDSTFKHRRNEDSGSLFGGRV